MMAFIFRRSTTPAKVSSAPIGITTGNRITLQALLHLVIDLEEISAGTVHLVDEREAGTWYLLA